MLFDTVKHICYDLPGSPPNALKQRQVSSMMTGPSMVLAASLHFSRQTSSGVPWYSGINKRPVNSVSCNNRYFLNGFLSIVELTKK